MVDTKKLKKAISGLIECCNQYDLPIVGSIEIDAQLVPFGNTVQGQTLNYKHVKFMAENKGHLENFLLSLREQYPKESEKTERQKRDNNLTYFLTSKTKH
jgi:hypothetical protein